MRAWWKILTPSERIRLMVGIVAFIVGIAALTFTLLTVRTASPLPQAVPPTRTSSNTLYGIPRENAIVLLGGESHNPRLYDPATGDPGDLVFSGLVTFSPQLEVIPDLAESWSASTDKTVYTFHLRKNAHFHNGRPVKAEDVIYSWERAADAKLQSVTALTYLGDIVGIQDKQAGRTEHISGLRSLDESTLQVTIDGPKPYFLMKLTTPVAYVVDRANVESGRDWYLTPNGTGPYKLKRWDKGVVQIYERNDDFYLPPTSIRYVIYQLYAGIGSRLYELNQLDVAGISYQDVPRIRESAMRDQLFEGISMCTGYIAFDTTRPPFDDKKVRQAFVLAINKQQYLDIAFRGVGLPAHGLYPPALPGYDPGLRILPFNPALARARLAESKYGSTLPPITFSISGMGSYIPDSTISLIAMWQATLGVTIQVENLEPDKASELLQQGYHGQIFSYGWCADYPDPENFADALFHTDAPYNFGKYSNPALDKLLEQARVEPDTEKRLKMYQEAERIIVDDAPALFLNHSLRFVLVKPWVRGYKLTIGTVPLLRFLSVNE